MTVIEIGEPNSRVCFKINEKFLVTDIMPLEFLLGDYVDAMDICQILIILVCKSIR